MIVTLLEYFLEPFTRNYSEHRYAYWIICVFHAGIVTTSYLIAALTLQLIGQPSVWRIRHEAIFTMSVLTLLGIGNFLIRDLIYDNDNWRWYLFFEEMVHGYLAGTLFYFMITQLNVRILAERNNPLKPDLISIQNDHIHIEAAVAADSFTVNMRNILCVKSDGNYAVFYLKSEDQVETRLIRQTMDKLEEQLSHRPEFLRTHRAYIVNIDFLISHQGNTAGYQLVIDHLDFKVPVSRSNVRKFEHSITAV